MPTLYLMPTPINGDFSLLNHLAKDLLCLADIIIGEEKKQTIRLLAANNLREKPFLLLNEHTNYEEKFNIAKLISNKKTAILFSDAGTPCVSDPGYDLVDLCYGLNINVKTLCFESSVMAALSASGFYAEKFVYAGFPPIKGGERLQFFKNLPVSGMTTVFLERPYALKKVVDELKHVKTRIFIHINIGFENETFLRGHYKDFAAKKDSLPKAPFAVVIEGKNE